MKYVFGLAVFACAFLLEFNFAHAAERTCSADVIATCAQLDAAALDAAGDKGLGFPKSQIGEVTLNAYAYLKTFGTPSEANVLETFKRMKPASPKQKQKAMEMAGKIKKQAMALILGLGDLDLVKDKYTEAEKKTWTSEQRALFERLDTLHIKPAPSGDEACKLSAALPNAFYDQDTHTIRICEFTFKQNSQYIAHMLSHEIGHVVSPCANSLSLYRIEKAMGDDDAVASCDSNFVPRNELSRTPSTQESRYISSLRESNASHFVNDSWMSFPKELEKCGLATEEDASRTPNTQLFASAKSCIEKKTWRIYENKYRALAAIKAQQMKTSFEEGMKKVKQDSLPMCLQTASEQFADAFEAQVLGAWAEKNKWTPIDMRSALIAMRGSVCSEEKNGTAMVDPEQYPVSAVRLQTLLNSDSIAGRLGCAPVAEVGLCPLKMRAPNGSSNSSPTTSAQ
jgi:hypothetical protein